MQRAVPVRSEALADLSAEPAFEPWPQSQPRESSREVHDEVATAATTSRPRWWRDQLRRRLLLAADVLVATLVSLATAALAGAGAVWALAVVPCALLAAKLLGLYDADHRAIRHLTVDEFPALVAWGGTAATIAALLVPGHPGGSGFLVVFAAAVVGALAFRSVARWLWRRVTPPERTLVVGEGDLAEAIGRKIELFDDMHMQLRRVTSPQEHIAPTNGIERPGVDGGLDDIDRVVLAWSDARPALIERLLDQCRSREIKLSVVSPFRGRARPAPNLSLVADLPILEYATWDVPRSTTVLKRALDLVVSTTALILLAPLFLVLAIAIKLEDRGPVFFRQSRVGRDGRPFTMLKFRSMAVDAEARLGEVVDLGALDQPMFKLRRDPRVTRCGRLLRRFSLDELPQLVNVLRGDMSLVGPRPEEVQVVERYEPEHRFRLEMKPGVTGPMQVFGRGELTFQERLAVERDYFENISVLRDVHLLAQTMPAVVRGRGAF